MMASLVLNDRCVHIQPNYREKKTGLVLLALAMAAGLISYLCKENRAGVLGVRDTLLRFFKTLPAFKNIFSNFI